MLVAELCDKFSQDDDGSYEIIFFNIVSVIVISAMC